MMLTRWSPNRDLTTLHEEMDRLFTSLLPSGTLRPVSGRDAWAPPADIRETPSDYVVRMDLPGIDPKQVKVSVHDGTLTVRGERREEKEDKDETWHRVERFHGIFERRFELGGVAAEKIEATYRDGVLQVRIPKSEAAKPRQIEVRVQNG